MSEQWLEVTLPVPAQELDWVCDVLTANGMAGLVVEEEGEFLRFLEQNRQYWDYVDEGLAARMKGASRVKFYVPDNQEGQRQLRQYLSGLERYEPQTISLREEDWATSWQKYYPVSYTHLFRTASRPTADTCLCAPPSSSAVWASNPR